MNDKNYEQLARDWPLLFQKSGDFEFSIGDGWYDIIDVLCSSISYAAENASRCLANELAKEQPNQDVVEKWQKRLAEEVEKLPVIVQVKEKFGGLRFYVDGGSSEIYSYIDFAEQMSHKVCEVCGNRGERRGGSWIKTLCDIHEKKRESS